jgi:uncharacterized membrane protein YqaE (UPF0057 family)
MRYVIAFFFPWLSLMFQGKILSGIVCLILQITIIGWLPAVIWAVVSVGGYNADKRTDRLVNAITQSARAVPATPDPRRI